MMKKIKLGLLSLSAVGLLAACGTDNNDVDTDDSTPDVEEQEEKATDTETETNDTSETPPTATDMYTEISVQPEEAFDLFLEQYPDTEITQIQLDAENNSYVYEVEGFAGITEYELKIDAIDGSILKEDTETDDDRDDGALTREQVTKVNGLVTEALADAGEGSILDEWTLDVDDGIAKLEIDLDRQDGEDVEYTYNVDTGELLEIDN